MINITKRHYFLVAIILSASTNAMSREITYDHVQGTYTSSSIDTGTSFGDVDATGFAVSGSFSISQNVAFTAGFEKTNTDKFLGVEIDSTALTFGVFAHTPIAPRTDVGVGYTVFKGDVDVSDGFTTISDNDTGNVISFGLRHMANDTVELDVEFARVDIFDDKINSTGFGVRLYVNEKSSFAIGYSTGDDVDTILLNARIAI